MQNKLYGAEITVSEERGEVAKLQKQLKKTGEVKAFTYCTRTT